MAVAPPGCTACRATPRPREAAGAALRAWPGAPVYDAEAVQVLEGAKQGLQHRLGGVSLLEPALLPEPRKQVAACGTRPPSARAGGLALDDGLRRPAPLWHVWRTLTLRVL